jgi:RsiW-degrading membrane proteinase PrsW (M82 family)
MDASFGCAPELWHSSPAPSPAHSPTVKRSVGAALVALLLLAALVLGERAGGLPAVIVAAAMVPALGAIALVLLLDRDAPEPWVPLLGVPLWGATIAAMGASALNDAALHATAGSALSGLVPIVVGPLVEEAAKASVFLPLLTVWRRALGGARDGLVYGALAGIGFAATENLDYYTLAAVQGGAPGLARALYLRGLLQGLNHAAFTATTGAALGDALHRRGARRAVVAVAGFGLAVTLHALWNARTATTISRVLCNAPTAGGACTPAPDLVDLLVTVPVLTASFIGPVAAALVALALRADRRAPGGRST